MVADSDVQQRRDNDVGTSDANSQRGMRRVADVGGVLQVSDSGAGRAVAIVAAGESCQSFGNWEQQWLAVRLRWAAVDTDDGKECLAV